MHRLLRDTLKLSKPDIRHLITPLVQSLAEVSSACTPLSDTIRSKSLRCHHRRHLYYQSLRTAVCRWPVLAGIIFRPDFDNLCCISTTSSKTYVISTEELSYFRPSAPQVTCRSSDHTRVLLLMGLIHRKLSAYMRDVLMQPSADLLSHMYSKDIRAITFELYDPDECMLCFGINLAISRNYQVYVGSHFAPMTVKERLRMHCPCLFSYTLYVPPLWSISTSETIFFSLAICSIWMCLRCACHPLSNRSMTWMN